MADTLSDGFHGRVAAALALPTAANGDSFQARLTLASVAIAAGITTSPDGFIERLILTGLVGATPPPGTPSLFFDGQNMDGTNNSSMVDAQAIGTWANPGSLGAGGNAVQAVAGSKPTFRLVATPGKINNKSAAESIDTLRSMATAAFASQNQPYVVAAVFRNNNGAGVSTVLGSSGGGMKWYSIGGGQMHLEVSSVGVTSSGSPAVGQWHMITGTVNGASSELRVDGVSTLGTCGASAFGTIATLFDSGAGQNMQGFLAEALYYFGALPSLAAIETYFTAKYGAFPQ